MSKTMASLLKHGGVVAAAVAASLPCAPPAHAQSVTGIQNNGAECVRRFNHATANFSRSTTGFINTSTSDIQAMCPIVRPSKDSSVGNAQEIKDVEVFYSGSTAPDCWIQYRSTTGSLYWSSQLTQGTSSTSGSPVLKLTSFKPVATFASSVLLCTLAQYEGIRGLTALHTVGPIEGGLPY